MTDFTVAANLSGTSFMVGPLFRATVTLGKNGVVDAADKQEGDGKTPLGRFPVRHILYRKDRLSPPSTRLKTRVILPTDGWCDDPDHASYNQSIVKPFTASHEELWRVDHVYDMILLIGYNDEPVVPGRGSAIFVHVMRPDRKPTEGCVAMSLGDMKRLVRLLLPGDHIGITV